jgi:poly-gamma-glutamate capsule biosynthesis protein CapA/YwtB (metallophosphatase superfamily)
MLRSTLRRAVRLAALILLTSAGHLLLLWLYNPITSVPAPRQLPAPADTAVEPTRSGDEVVLLFGGDTAPADAALPLLARHGYEYPFAPTVDLLRSADLAVVNLEAPVTERQQGLPLYKRYVYKVAPEGLRAMRWAGVDAVTLANNHALDYGRPGLRDTLEHLRASRVVALGAGRDAAAARRGAVWRIRGTRIGVLAYLEDSFMHSLYVRSFAWGGFPGVARLEAAQVKRDIARMRRHADVVIVVAHWGRNYTGVTLLQRLYGRLLVEAGADAVIGHHPHIHHPVGLHRGRPIIYSLGNYAFGTPGRSTFRHGLLARLRVRGRRLRQVELIPLTVQNRIVRFKPERTEPAPAREMMRALAARSAPLGATVKVRSDGVGVIEL